MKILIIPIGIVGCGKTTLAKHLSTKCHLTHIQSDDIQTQRGQRKGQVFVDTVISAFQDSEIVFADRNNHLVNHRVELISAFRHRVGGNILVLDWGVEQMDRNTCFNTALDRIKERGTEHQTLHANNPKLGMILNTFLKDRVPFGKEEAQSVDKLVRMNMLHQMDANLKLVLEAIHAL